MLGAIAWFEIKSRLARASTYVYFACFLLIAFLFMNLAGGAFPGARVEFGTAGKVPINSPVALAAFTALLSTLGVLVSSAIVGRAVFQDFESDSHALFFTKPIRKLDYLGGRFLGAVAVVLGIFPSLAIGFWVGSKMPWLDRTRVGPTIGWAYLSPYLGFVLPNLLFSGAIFFALAALVRRILPIYVAAIVLVVGYLTAGGLIRDLDNKTIAALIDPFGLNAMFLLTEYWTVAERSVRLVPLEGLFLANRLIWVGVGGALALFTYRRFAFAHLPAGRRKKEPTETAAMPAGLAVPDVRRRFDATAELGAMLQLARLQLRETVKSVYFVAIVLAGVLFVLATSTAVGKLYGTKTYPVTYAVLEVVHGNFTLFALIIIAFYAGELVWRERDARLDQIVDATPAPTWVLFGSKLLALLALQVILLTVVGICGVGIQLVRGYTHLELGLYAKELYGLKLCDFCLLSVLALLVHVVVNQKYMGHFVMILYYVFAIAQGWLGIEHHLLDYGGAPDYTYSDMNGYGHFAAPLVWFRLYWAAFAVALAVGANLLWVRGTESGGRWRLQLARGRLSGPSRLALGGALVAFAAFGGTIFWNTNIRNAYRTTKDNRKDAAAYERAYRKYLPAPRPRVTSVDMAVDLFPSERRAHIRSSVALVNASGHPMSTIYLTLPRESRLRSIGLGREEKVTLRDDRLGFLALELGRPLAPDETCTMTWEAEQAAHGFVNGGDAVKVYENGTFFDTETLPTLGYVEGRELSDDADRRKEGLAPKERAHPLEDETYRQVSGLDGADWVRFHAVVSTSADQLAVAPGTLVRAWSEKGRRFFEYRMDGKTLNFYAFLSARYQVLRDRWNGVAIEIDYHRGHEYDLARMVDGIKKSLDYYTRNFSPFQFQQVRILEFPRYATFAESFPSTIPYSEGIGFIAKVDPRDPDDVDYPFYVTAHEVGHQWWAHQVIGADVQGTALLAETLAQYSALMVMKHEVGPGQMKRFLKFELDRYLRGRGSEKKKELPLYKVETQDYIYYQKGSVAMYALQDLIGEDRVNLALRRLIAKYAFRGPPYPRSTDLLDELRAVAPPEYQRAIGDLFERIVLYQNRAVKATYRPVGGKYQVRLTIEGKKLEADEQGSEKEVPIDDFIDVGVLDDKGEPLWLEKRRINRPRMEFTMTVDRPPARAGIDPLVKLIDRKWEDNTVKVERE